MRVARRVIGPLLAGTCLTGAALSGAAPSGASAQSFTLDAAPPAKTDAVAPAPVSTAELGAGLVLGPSAWAGRYGAPGADRSLALLGAAIRTGDPWNGAQARFLDADLAARAPGDAKARIDWGDQDVFRLRFLYAASTRSANAQGASPYRGVGGAELTLPADWIAASRSGDFAALARSLRPLDLSVTRQRGGLDLTMRLGGGDSLALAVSHERRQGLKGQSLAFGGDANVATAAFFPEPIDTDTSRIEARYAHRGERARWSLAYAGILFSDHIATIRVQNPFGPIGLTAPAAIAYPTGFGAKAAPPSSSAHQIRAAGALDLGPVTRVTANAALGVERQDDPFPAYTVNPALSVTTPPPRASLGGLVINTLANAQLTTRPWRWLDLTLALDRDARDNRTPRALYLYIVDDAQNQPAPRVAGNSQNARINPTYGWARASGRIEAGLRLPWALKANATWRAESMERRFSSVALTREQTGRLRLSRTFDQAALSLSWSIADRRGSAYVPNAVFFDTRPAVVTSQFTAQVVVDAPAFRKVDLADRRRQEGKAALSLDVAPGLAVNLSGALRRDEYPRSVYGVSARESGLGDLDLSWRASERLSVSGFYTLERLLSRQSGYYLGGFALDNPDQAWATRDRDLTHSLGARADWIAIPGRLTLRLDAHWTQSRSRVDTVAGPFSAATATAPLPAATSAEFGGRVDADIVLAPDLDWRLAYGFTRYATRDWAEALARQTAYANLLSFGAATPRAATHAITSGLRYRF